MKTLALALLNGTSAAALYFLVAMGFTLTFGLMRTVNLAYGALYPVSYTHLTLPTIYSV